MRHLRDPGRLLRAQPTRRGGGIAALRTDVAGFVGIAERGPLHLAVPVESSRQFEAWFGRLIDQRLPRVQRARLLRERRPPAAGSCASRRDGRRRRRRSPSALGRQSGVAHRGVEPRRRGATPSQLRLVERRRVADAAVASTRSSRRASTSATPRGLGTVDARRSSRGHGSRARGRRVRRPGAAARLRLRRRAERRSPVNAALARRCRCAYTLDVYEPGVLVAQFEDLSLVPRHPRYGPAMLTAALEPSSISTCRSVDRPRSPEPDLAVDYFRVAPQPRRSCRRRSSIRELRDGPARAALDLLDGDRRRQRRALAGGADGLAALGVLGLRRRRLLAGGLTMRRSLQRRRGIAALEVVDEVALVAVPDIHIRPRPVHPLQPPPACVPDPCLPGAPPAPCRCRSRRRLAARVRSRGQIVLVQAALVDQCERLRDRVALLDAPFETCDRADIRRHRTARAWRHAVRLDLRGALYALGRVVDPLRTQLDGPARADAGDPAERPRRGPGAATDLRAGVHVAAGERAARRGSRT